MARPIRLPLGRGLLVTAALLAACGGRDSLWLAGGAGGAAGSGGSGGGAGGSGGSGTAFDCKQCEGWDAGPCNTVVCDATARRCAVEPKVNGSSCDDGDFCTVGETCQFGRCEGGTEHTCGLVPEPCSEVACNRLTRSCNVSLKDCSATPLPGSCWAPQCNASTGQCEAAPVTGGSCDDPADRCTLGKTCSAGVCSGGTSVDCSALDAECNVGTCDPSTGSCFGKDAPDGSACDDGDPCTAADACAGGACLSGAPVTSCTSGDLCCPSGCTGLDDDCPLTELVLQATQRGWWRSNGLHSAVNDNTFTGFFDGGSYHSYFTFDLSSVASTVLTASLVLEQEQYYGPHASESLSLWDVGTDAATLEADGMNTAVYDDLGTGTGFGSFVITPAATGTLHEVELNAAAVQAINEALGGFFSVGLRVDTLTATPATEGVRFSAGQEARVHQLVLSTL